LYHFISFLAQLVSRLPKHRLEVFARWLAKIAFDGLRIRRSLILKNLQIALGEPSDRTARLALARHSVYNFCLTILEFLYSWENDPTDHVSIEGKEHLDAVLQRNKGAFILCCHLGNWEAMGAKLRSVYGPTWVPVKKIANSGLDRFVAELRHKSSFLPLPRVKKGDGFKNMREALAKNQLVGIVVDQTRPGEPKLPFFGHPAKTNTSYAAIWRRLGEPPVVPAFIERTSFFTHKITILPELTLKKSGDFAKDILDHSEIFNQVAEQMIRKAPHLYFWYHARWKA
jgi:KDO2-lipid IV(A) lauroyltransferase